MDINLEQSLLVNTRNDFFFPFPALTHLPAPRVPVIIMWTVKLVQNGALIGISVLSQLSVIQL